jgi:uncharacterized repeat protein (TIGR01451 family)
MSPVPVLRARRARRALRSAVAAVLGATLVVGGATAATAVESSVPVAPNPALADHCDMRMAISLDLSNSVTAPQLTAARAELAGLAGDLQGYPVQFAVHTFASNAPATTAAANQPLPLTSLATADGVAAFDAYVQGVQRPAQAQGGTNWDRAFAAVAASAEQYDAMLLVTDGNPTQYASPAQGPGSSTNQATIDAAVRSANDVKAEGTRVIPIGVQDNLAGQALADFREHVAQVSGPTEGSDYYLAGFTGLRSTLVDIVNATCASVDLQKTGTLAAGATGAPGDTVDYAFTVVNDGAVTLTDVRIADPKPGLSAVAFGAWPGQPGVLEPGQRVTATATYVLTAADVAAGVVDNTARAIGSPPAGRAVEDEAPARVVLPAPVPAIALTKTGALDGDAIAYSFVVTNTGTVTLTGVGISDELPGLSDVVFGTWPAAAGTLAPGQQVTASASYTPTQADRDRGFVENTATATGTPPTGPAVTDVDEHEQPLVQTPAIALTKTGVLDGDAIAYSFVVTNTGTVTLTGVGISDELPGLSDVVFGTWPAAAGTLAPGQQVTASARYPLSTADRDRGEVVNTATALGTPPAGSPVRDADDAVVPVPATPAVALVKTGTLADGIATYTFTATNTGDTTLTGVAIADPLPNLSALSYGAWPGASGVLAPGQSITATAAYALEQADRDRGSVVNTAAVSGTPPRGDDVTDSDDVTLPVPQAPGIQLVKSGELAGDGIAYSFVVTNVGDVTLTGVAVADELHGLSDVSYGDWPAAAGTLAPGESVTATASYVLTQDDRDAGRVANTATVLGTPPRGDDVSDADTFEQPVPQNPGISLVKTGAQDGDTVRFSFVVSNTGDVTLTNVGVHDAIPGLSDVVFGAWPTGAGRLAPGETVTATAALALTATHHEAGEVVNTAIATGTPPVGAEVADEDTVVVAVRDLAATGLSGERMLGVGTLGAITLLVGAAAVLIVRRRGTRV